MSGASAFRRETGTDGVLVVTLDVPGEKVNTLGKGLIAEFEGLLDEVEKDASVRALVVRSGKPDSFVAGADIKDFTRIRSAEEGEALSRTGHAILDRIAACRVPVVAAIHGTCLGGGTELALAETQAEHGTHRSQRFEIASTALTRAFGSNGTEVWEVVP